MKKGIIILIILILTTTLIVCTVSISKEKNTLPAGAILISDRGNGWIEFELEGKRFLFYKSYYGFQGFAAITQIQ